MVRISTGNWMDFVRLLRPHFLVGSVILFLIGTNYAFGGMAIVTLGLVIAILSALLVQLAGQLSDEYFDRDGDVPSKRTLFAGGSGVIQSGSISARSVLWMTMGTCAISLLLATAAAFTSDRWLLPPLIALGLASGLAYSATPVRLSSTWFGEGLVAFMIAFVLPLTGSYFANGTLDLRISVVSLPIFLITLQALIAVEFPDMEADRASGKRNLTYRLGIHRSKFVHVSILFLAYLTIILEVILGYLNTGALLLLVTAPFSIFTSWKIIRMKNYDFTTSKNTSNMAMTVNGISLAIMLIYVTLLGK
jgi:1,4-dihydroxy-2-naphthoate polyprenyltransferase